MPIVSLLKEWSEIEPDRCSYVGDMFAIRGWTLTQYTDIADRLVNAEIQCAVQESIESHGWHWVVGRIAIEKGIYYKGRISIQPESPAADSDSSDSDSSDSDSPDSPAADDKAPELEAQPATPRLNTYLSTHSPTHVLLQAYVDALKVMAKVQPGDEEAIHGEIINKHTDAPAPSESPATETETDKPEPADALSTPDESTDTEAAEVEDDAAMELA